MWTILKKVLLNLLQYCFCFVFFWSFGHKACGIPAPQQGIEPAPPALEGEVPTTGPMSYKFNGCIIFPKDSLGNALVTLWIHYASVWIIAE